MIQTTWVRMKIMDFDKMNDKRSYKNDKDKEDTRTKIKASYDKY